MESVRQLFADLSARTMTARYQRRLTLASEMEALNYEEVKYGDHPEIGRKSRGTQNAGGSFSVNGLCTYGE